MRTFLIVTALVTAVQLHAGGTVTGNWSVTGGDNPDSGSVSISDPDEAKAYRWEYEGLGRRYYIAVEADGPGYEYANFYFNVWVPNNELGTYSFGTEWGEGALFDRLQSREHYHRRTSQSHWPTPISERTVSGAVTISVNTSDRLEGSFVFDETITFASGEKWAHQYEGSFAAPKIDFNGPLTPINYSYDIVNAQVIDLPEAAESAPLTLQAIVPAGKEFAGWDAGIYRYSLIDLGDGKAVFNLPGNSYVAALGRPVIIEAELRDAVPQVYTVTVVTPNGSQSLGQQQPGTTVTISAPSIVNGSVFKNWTGSTGGLADQSAYFTTLTMPEANVALTAVYEESPGLVPDWLPGTYARWTVEDGVTYKETLILDEDFTGSYDDDGETYTFTWAVNGDGSLTLDVVEIERQLNYVLTDVVDGELHVRGDTYDDVLEDFVPGDVVMYKVSADEDLPNLRGTLFEVVGDPITYSPVDPIEVKYTVKNVSNTDMAQTGFTVHFYLAGAGHDISPQRQLLGEVTVNEQLLGNTDTGVLTVNLGMPQEIPNAGQTTNCHYKIGMIIDLNNSVPEEDDTDNSNFGGGKDYDSTTIHGPAVLKFDPFDVLHIGPHVPEEAIISVGNLVNVGYCAALNIDLTAVFNDTDIKVGVPEWEGHIERINAGDFEPLRIDSVVPPGSDPSLAKGDGTYYLNAEASFVNEISAFDPAAHVFGSAPLIVDVPADLVPSSFSVVREFLDSPPFRPGDDVDLGLRIRNRGWGASGEVKTSVWLSRDREIDDGDHEILPRLDTPAINGATTLIFSNPTVTLPGAGNPVWQADQNLYYLLVQVDSTEQEKEDDEDNNSTSIPYIGAAPVYVSNQVITPPVGGKVIIDPDTPNRFLVEPDEGFEILGVTVAGVPQGAVDQVTVNSMLDTSTITVDFGVREYLVTTLASPGGSISPANPSVQHGGSVTLTIHATGGHSISQVYADGVVQGVVGSYTFSNVTAEHELRAVFVQQDGDSDGLDDDWELEHFGGDGELPDGDFDNDGEDNLTEYINGTDPGDAGSTADPENAYPFVFEIYRVIGGGFGMRLVCRPHDGARFGAGTLIWPDDAELPLSITDAGRVATASLIAPSYAEIAAALPAGTYEVELGEAYRDGRRARLRFVIEVKSFNEGQFPNPVTLVSPGDVAVGQPIDLNLVMSGGGWDRLALTAGARDRTIEYPNASGTNSLQVSGLRAVTDYTAVVKTDNTGYWLSTHTVSTFRTAPEHRLGVGAGWSMISVPFDETPGARALRGGFDAPIWRFDTSVQRFRPLLDYEMMKAGVGYWVYSTAGTGSDLLSGTEIANRVTLQAGWNSVGPVRDVALPREIRHVFGWDGERYFRLSDSDLPDWQIPGMLMQGHAYWVYSRDDRVVELE